MLHRVCCWVLGAVVNENRLRLLDENDYRLRVSLLVVVVMRMIIVSVCR